MKRFIPSSGAFHGTLKAARCLIGILALTALTGGQPNTAKAQEPEKPSADSADARREQVMKNILSRPFKNDGTMLQAVPFTLSAYWLNERRPEADAAVIRAASPDLPGVGSGKDVPGNHWHYNRQSFLLQRVYFLFNSRSEYFPGRMSKAAEDAVAATMWKWASTACTKEMTRPESMWWNGGSENIIGRQMASLWGAAQIFASHPDYLDRKYADGTPVPEMAKAFNDYYKQFTRERASKGVMVEVSSGYNDWTLAAWYNIADFSLDPVTRKNMKMFLDLYLADYAIEQIDGVRGGSRHRCYPGPASIEAGSSGSELAWLFYGLGKAVPMSPQNVGLMTTFYRPSPVLGALVRAGAERGTYEYVSRRLGKGATIEQVGKPEKEKSQASNTIEEEDSNKKPSDGKPTAQVSKTDKEREASAAFALCTDPNGGNLLRYTFCTPDFVMGTSMVPALPTRAWTPISSQNRWEGVIFAGHATARIFPQAEGSHAMNASWSVQNKGVVIVQRLEFSKAKKFSLNAKRQRVWFDASLKREERDGWVFAEAPQAYAAVRVVEGGSRWEPEAAKKGRPVMGMWLRCENEYSPVIIDVARKSDYPDFASFQKAILANALTWKNNRLDYRSDSYKTQLTLFADYSKPPEVDGTAINYSPAKCYDSPFIQGDWGSGVVTIQNGDRKLVLNFNE